MQRGHVTVAAGQFRSEPGALAANLAEAATMMLRAAQAGAALVVLPECCLSGYDLDWIRAGAPGGGSPLPGPLLDPLLDCSRRLGIPVVVNELERADDGLYSTTVILGDGRLLGRHRKSVITVGEHEAGLRAGDAPAVPVALPHFPLPVAPMICFEHGFPEIALDLALAGAGLLAISSAIGTGNEYLRDLRTRARAQDNGVFIVAANAVGPGWCGASMIVDARGDVLAVAATDEPELLLADIDPGLVEHQRRLEPVLTRRRPELRRF
ncbi:MAG: carbon-nitrogen hydrolase family protein [Acidimicrobiales bacterium]